MPRLALLLAACLWGAPLAAHDDHGDDRHDEAHGDEDAAHVFEAGGLHATHPWTRATTTGEALVFVEIENRGDQPVALLGATSEDAEAGALVGFRLENGEPSWVEIGRATLKPGEEIDLVPHGLAIRLTSLARPLEEGGALHLTLETEAGPLPIEAVVEAKDATAHSHAGHAHE